MTDAAVITRGRVDRRDRRGCHHDPAGPSQGLALRSRSPTRASSRNPLSLLVACRRGFDGLGPLPGAVSGPRFVVSSSGEERRFFFSCFA